MHAEYSNQLITKKANRYRQKRVTLTCPKKSSSTSSGEIEALLIDSLMAMAPNSWAFKVDNFPQKAPANK